MTARPSQPPLRRRDLLAAAPVLALAACGSRAETPADAAAAPWTPLKHLAPFPIGTCAMTGHLTDPAWRAVADREFSQVTPEWEFQMQRVLADDGSFRFDAADAIAAWAGETGKRLHGTSLVWYAQDPPAFRRLDGNRLAFERAFRTYLLTVAGRYRGRANSWDVVNEAVAEDGNGLRGGLWAANLGEGWIEQSFELAAEADPVAVRFLNDYNLERPEKRLTFLRLLERLLKRGVPVTGVGMQSHLDVTLAPGAYRTALGEVAGFGLPVHVSELDISFGRGPAAVLRGEGRNAAAQAQVAAEVMESFLDLPHAQRFAFTTWGVRDGDSWLRRPPNNEGAPTDRPLLFDDAGAPKPAARALARAMTAA